MPIEIDAGGDVVIGGSVTNGDTAGRDLVGKQKGESGLLAGLIKILFAVGLGGPAKMLQKLFK